MAGSSDELGGQGKGSDARQELRDYLVKVNEELAKRKERVELLASEIAQIEFKIKELRTNRAIGAGDISSVGSLERFRSHLKEQLARKKSALKELNSDVERAQQRREEVMKELSALDLTEGGKPG